MKGKLYWLSGGSSVDEEIILVKHNLMNYPNPFNPETTIYFSLTTELTSLRNATAWQAESTELVIYNVKGQKVKTFAVTLSGVEGSNGNEGFTPSPSTTLRVTQAGSITYSIIWNGTDDNNKPVSSGIYFYKLRAGDFQKVKKMVVLK